MLRLISVQFACSVVALCVSTQTTSAQSVELGIHDLAKRLGPLTPTGSGVVVGQVEAAESPGNYGPNQADGEFVGHAFLPQSGAPGNSGHATLVGQNFYGDTLGMAPGITTTYLWDAVNWLQTGFLRLNQGSANPPLSPPGGLKILNHSWVGSIGNVGWENECNRRADSTAVRDQLIYITGVNNGPAQVPLMTFMYNGISVGLTNGTHTSGATPGTHEGPGRQKPEIVAPSQFTSFATPYVSAIAARLVQAARTAPLLGNPFAQRSEVIKAVLLAGANHRTGWSNNPATSGPTRGVTSTPIDPQDGVDVANANNSHLILTGLEQNGADTPPTVSNVIRRGWDLASISGTNSKYYRFRITKPADKVSILAAWNRIINTDLVNWSLANFTLTLHRTDAAGNLLTLVGDPGLPYFASGNVVSQSAVDNIEHLFIQNLQPGHYAIQVQRIDGLGGTRDVAVAWLLPKIIGDLNEDGVVNTVDLLQVINSWGACPSPCVPYCPADVTNDCLVNTPDLLGVINNWTIGG